jgi:hypothetical protein
MENIKQIKNNAGTFLQASKETVKKTNVNKSKYMNIECTKSHWHMVIHPNAIMHNVVSPPLPWVEQCGWYGGIPVGQGELAIKTGKKAGGEWCIVGGRWASGHWWRWSWGVNPLTELCQLFFTLALDL